MNASKACRVCRRCGFDVEPLWGRRCHCAAIYRSKLIGRVRVRDGEFSFVLTATGTIVAILELDELSGFDIWHGESIHNSLSASTWIARTCFERWAEDRQAPEGWYELF